MVSHRFSPPLTAAIAVVLLASTALAADCTKVARASNGETCASLTQQYGISVTDFINYNPSLTTCTLSSGIYYCVSQNPADGPPVNVPTVYVPTGPSGPQPTGLIPSPPGSDGVCGGEWTCLGSVYGDCCSQNNYCGNETAYCGEGCKPGYGRCGGGVEEPGPGTGPVTATSTTRTTTFRASTRPTTTTTTTTTRTTTRRTTTTTTTRGPSPTLPGAAARCNKYHEISRQDTCQRLARTFDVTTLQIEIWNPRFDCSDISDFEGYSICVGVRSCLLGLICIGDSP